jgi:HAD superfamily hydrolase (TIGR01509 family)
MHNNLKEYSLVIFDCDGTLADSEIAHNQVLCDQLHDIGLFEYTAEKCMEMFMGRAITDIIDDVETRHNVRFPNNPQLAHDKYRDIMPTVLRLDPTCRPVLEALRANRMKMAVGSNGTRVNVLETIKAAGFDEFFPPENIFTFENVENPKPAPDLYLHICEVMHTHPSHALVVEDTVPGAMAGLSGKIDTVGYVGLTHRKGQAERLKDINCHYVIKEMGELADIVYPKDQNGKVA